MGERRPSGPDLGRVREREEREVGWAKEREGPKAVRGFSYYFSFPIFLSYFLLIKSRIYLGI